MLICTEQSYGPEYDKQLSLWHQYRNNLSFIISEALIIDHPM